MNTESISSLNISDPVLIAAPVDSTGAKHNGKIGRITGFVRNWFVLVDINGEGYRFYPTDLVNRSGTPGELVL